MNEFTCAAKVPRQALSSCAPGAAEWSGCPGWPYSARVSSVPCVKQMYVADELLLAV